MYLLKKLIANVFSFTTILDKLFYTTSNGKIFLDSKEIPPFFDDPCYAMNFQEKMFLWDPSGQGVLLNEEPIHIKTATGVQEKYIVTNVFKKENNKWIHEFNLYDIDKKEHLFPKPLEDDIVIHNGLFLTHPYPRISISRVSETGTPLWQFAFSQLAPVYWDANTPDTLEKIIGVAHGNVWVTTDGGRLVAINANTGELTKVFTRIEEEQIHGYECTHGLGWVYLNPNDSHIHCMSSFHYYKINTKTLSVDESYQYKELEPNAIGQFGIRQTLLQGDYFTFLGVKEGESQIRWAGIYDYKLRKTVWLHCVISDEEVKKGNELNINHPPKMAGNKLYIKDFKHNLHVFEKEEVVS